MPDWSYQTVFKPILFRLPVQAARKVSLPCMGGLARMPLGGRVIDFMGHMAPDARLAGTVGGISLASPVGLGARLDPELTASTAFARFGFGFLEVGPISLHPNLPLSAVERRDASQAIAILDRDANAGLQQIVKQLARSASSHTPIVARLIVEEHASAETAAADCLTMMPLLASYAKAFAFDTLRTAVSNRWSHEVWQHYCIRIAAAPHAEIPRFICVSADADWSSILPLVRIALDAGFGGVLITGEIAEGTRGVVIGKPTQVLSLGLVHKLRQEFGTAVAIVASGGVHTPDDALSLFAAGADLVQIDTGLVFSGPGLPKRVNDALLYEGSLSAADESISQASAQAHRVRPGESDWLWALLMGVGMLVGGILAIIIASTRVVLPYDEDFVCMSVEQLNALNDRLLAFMSHDRVSLSGTMLAIGVVYTVLAWCGMRQGLHWARVAVIASAFAGFGTFFLFLGFGYFDPFHAFVTAILFQFLLLAVHGRANQPRPPQWPNLINDWQWRTSQWGQLVLIAHGAALITAGLVISFLGSTTVFVPEDLQFMRTTASSLAAANPKILPLVAHDRASFGGMILASGIATFLAALWGFQQGRRWLWWMLAISGAVAYVPAIGVHYAVGYINAWHLAPAYSGLVVLLLGLALSWPYLCRSRKSQTAQWRNALSRYSTSRGNV